MQTDIALTRAARPQRNGVAAFANHVHGFLLESRPAVQVVFMLRFFAAAALSGGPADGRLWWAAAAWSLATMAVYVVNGVMDVTEDRANGSSRPIARGALPAPVATTLVAAASVLSLALAAAVDARVLLPLVALHLACGYAYSGPPFHGKRRGSTTALLVLGLGVLTYAAGWSAGGRHAGLPVLLLGVAMSLWMAGVGALAKDLSDVAGDALGGRRTPVIVWGEVRTRALTAVNAVLIGAGFLTASLLRATSLVPVAAVLLLGGAAVAVLVATTRHGATRAVRRLPYRAFMFTQYAVQLLVLARFLLGLVHG